MTQITELLTKITVFAGRSVREANKALIFAEDNDVIQLGSDTRQVTNTIAISIHIGRWINLIEKCITQPSPLGILSMALVPQFYRL